MENRSNRLVKALGPDAAGELSGENAGASVDLVAALPGAEQAVVKQAFTESLRTMWIMYVALASMAVLVGLLVRGQTLSEVHVETRTGLDALRKDGEGEQSGLGGSGVGVNGGEQSGAGSHAKGRRGRWFGTPKWSRKNKEENGDVVELIDCERAKANK